MEWSDNAAFSVGELRGRAVKVRGAGIEGIYGISKLISKHLETWGVQAEERCIDGGRANVEIRTAIEQR